MKAGLVWCAFIRTPTAVYRCSMANWYGFTMKPRRRKLVSGWSVPGESRRTAAAAAAPMTCGAG